MHTVSSMTLEQTMSQQPDHMPPYLQGLNERQIEAVEQLHGPVLVLAGAGTGKTRALTTRLAHLLATHQVSSPGQILSVTFTNRAASEMKHRVSSLLGGVNVEGWWLGTFHSLSARMLRRHAERVGLRSNFTILDDDDQVRLLKQLMELEGMDTKKANARALAGVVSAWKDKGWRPEDVPNQSGKTFLGDSTPFATILKIYKAYQERLKVLNACDFGDLLLHMIHIFKDAQNGVLANYHAQFQYLLVDEYQDTNTAQYLWLRLLAQKHKNICCVGDDDQSIYGWRGAEIGNILRFEKDFPGAIIIRLEQNYRSTGHILKAANALISQNSSRLGKDLWTSDDMGEKVQVDGVWDGEKEAHAVCTRIEGHQDQGVSLNDMAILVRASSQMRSFEERLNNLGINYRVIGGPRFYERMEIRDALAYLRLVAQPNDDLAFERIINTPKRSIGKKSVQQLQVSARAMGVSLYEASSRLIETDELTARLRSSLRGFIDDVNRWRSMAKQESHTDLAGIILDESGYTKMWMDEKTADAQGRLDNLKELVNAMGEFDGLPAFLEHVSLVMERQESSAQEQITLMTLHAAKGLEFSIVFLPGWEEGLFPSQRSMDDKGLSGLEEERRLAYVGLTRAKRLAYVSYAANRRMYGSWVSSIPSRFVNELPKDHIVSTQEMSGTGSGYYSGQNRYGWSNNRNISKTQSVVSPSSRKVTPKDKIYVGSRIFHDKFGYGVVIDRDGDKLDITFDKAGDKRVIKHFVTPADQV